MKTKQIMTTSAASSSSNAETKGNCRQQSTQEDNASPSEEQLHPTTKADPFLYYSNDRVRMRELRLEDEEEEEDSSDEQSTNSCERKTRLTFELHPSLLLDDDLIDDDDELLSPDFEAFLAASIAAIKQDPDAVDDVINGLRHIMSS